MRSLFFWFVTAVGLLILLTISGAFYTVPETSQVVLTQFGQPIGQPVTTAGLHFKIPFIQEVNSLDKRVLKWEGASTEMPTEDKLYITVDTFARWRIADPLRYFLRLRDLRSGLSRLDDIIGSETRNTVARHALVEIVRTTKGRQPMQDETVSTTPGMGASVLPPIEHGRVKLEEEVSEQSRQKLVDFGIELLDVRFMRINYNSMVASKIADRMISERRQIADRFRSEGAGEAAKIEGTRGRDMLEIASEAYQKAMTLQGKADAEATAIYAEAYNQSPEAREFYEFQRALDIYRTALTEDTTLVLTTENGFFRHLQGEGASSQPASSRKIRVLSAPAAPNPPAAEPAPPAPAPATAPAPAPPGPQ
jgi:membrane protease subunit HflC